MAPRRAAATSIRSVRWWGVLVLMTGLALAVPRADAQPRPLLPAGTPVKIVVVPVKQGKNRVPAARSSTARSAARRPGTGASPTDGCGSSTRSPPPSGRTIRRSATRACRPGRSRRRRAAASTRPARSRSWIEATRDTSARSYGSVGSVQLRGTAWNRQSSITHELGHALGLDHATAPTVCRRPFRPLACTLRPRRVYEYGDSLDNMGGGVDRFTGYALAALGVVPVRDAPAGGGVTRLRSLEARDPTVLRLRTASHDWYVDTRRSEQDRVLRRRVRAPRGVGIARVQRALRAAAGPAPEAGPRARERPAARVPRRHAGLPRAPDLPARPAVHRAGGVPPARAGRRRGRAGRHALARPHAAAARGRGARIERPYGAPAQLVLPLRAAASGAGVLASTSTRAAR